jgi:YD repeat-containing protein
VVLCKRVQHATSDNNGAAGFAAAIDPSVPVREQRWTYSQEGQTLTYTDALGNTTTYSYHPDTLFSGTGPDATGRTKGDLATVTDPAGHVTSYPLYDKHGKWLEVVDPNGVSKTRFFDARQRLVAVQIGDAVTSYQYWPNGLLKKVSQPDGSFLSYEYDSAHRLRALVDHFDNRIEYTLDAMGNRTREVVRAPNGVVIRSLRYSIDSLGRVQLVTGRQ